MKFLNLRSLSKTLLTMVELARSRRRTLLTVHLRQARGGSGGVDVPQGFRDDWWSKRRWSSSGDGSRTRAAGGSKERRGEGEGVITNHE